MPEQTGTGIPHHFPDPFPHDGLVAMGDTMTAHRFSFPIWAFVEACCGIGQKSRTIRAQVFFPSVLCPAPQADHSLNSL